MRKQGKWHYLAVLAVLASCDLDILAGAEPDNQEEPKPLPPQPSATGSYGTVPGPPPAANGRDAAGKFAAGNKVGRGNPHARGALFG